MSTFTRITVLGLTALVLASPVAAFERGQVELTPFVGLYTATADNLSEEIPDVGSVTARRENTLAQGARLTFWVRPSLALELGGVYTSGSIGGQAFGYEGQMSASNFFGSGRLVFSPGTSESVRMLLSGGLVLASQSYELVDGSSFMAGVVGVGLHIPLGGSTALRLDADDYIYNSWWEIEGLRSTAITQHDIVATAGLSINLGR